MKLSVIGTGSFGNTYILEAKDEQLILDCGLSLMEVKKKLNFDLSKIVGGFVSHTHTDHSRYRKDYELAGIPIFAPYDREKIRENTTLGGFSLQAFQVPHGDTPTYGVLIRHDIETALYITDFSYTEYSFKACNVNHFIIEVNWQEKYVDLDAPNLHHKLAHHCSLATCKEFLRLNETWHMQNVIIVHMGGTSCDPRECVDEIKEILDVGVQVDYARPHEDYELTNKRLPFTEGD